MTVKFEYKCNNCSNEYVEQRAADEPLFFLNCMNCKNGENELVAETVISETVERVAAPEIELPLEPEVTE
jgi:uncharacterized protein (DUF983 family)